MPMRLRLSALMIVLVAVAPAFATEPQFVSTADMLAAYDQGDANARQLILLGLAQLPQRHP